MHPNESFVVFYIEIDRTTYSHRYIEIWITWVVNAKVWNGKAYYVTASKVDENTSLRSSQAVVLAGPSIVVCEEPTNTATSPSFTMMEVPLLRHLLDISR